MIEPIEASSPYFKNREEEEKIERIIIRDSNHREAGELLKYYQHNALEESAHYVVTSVGSIYQCVDDEFALKDGNDSTITIVLANPASAKQALQLQNLLQELCLKYVIPLNRIEAVNALELPMFDLLNSLGAAIMEQLLSNVEEDSEVGARS
jgi:N-acetyl-anhydromuramyl-L-alanine amidase AmpD